MYNKLVRDNIPDIIKSRGGEPITHILDDNEYKLELEKKLLEEANEVINSSGKDRIEELADLLEVMYALMELEDATLDDVQVVREEKASKRGAFTKKLYLEDVIE